MGDRIDREIFYDRTIVGVTEADEAEPTGWAPVLEVDSDRFFRTKDPRRGVENALSRLARDPWALAGIMFLAGFFTVFINQAPILYQLVFGAPIFEELVKFGLAFLITLALVWVFSGGRTTTWKHRAWVLLGLPIALAVGAGFGVMEHFLTYPDEPRFIFIGRIVFHSSATAFTMAAMYAVVRHPDVRVRWLAPVPAAIVHYLNNAGALVIGLPLGLVGAGDVALLYHLGVLCLGVGGAFFTAVAPAPIRTWLAALSMRAFPARTAPATTARDP